MMKTLSAELLYDKTQHALSLADIAAVDVLQRAATYAAVRDEEKLLRALTILYNLGYTPKLETPQGEAHVKRGQLLIERVHQGDTLSIGEHHLTLKVTAHDMGEDARLHWTVDGQLFHIDHETTVLRAFDADSAHWIRVDVRDKKGCLLATHTPYVVQPLPVKSGTLSDVYQAVFKPDIKAVLLDKDGTMIKFTEIFITATLEFVKYLGIEADEAKAALASIGLVDGEVKANSILSSGTVAEYCEALSAYSKSPVTEDIFDQYFHDFILEHPDEIIPTGDIVHLAKTLDERGIKLGIVTADNAKLTEATVDILGLSGYVHFMATGDIFPSKPSPEGLMAACDTFGVSSDQVLFVGDSNKDMMLGLLCGKVLGIASAYSDRAALEALSDGMIDVIEDVLDYI